MRKTGVGAVFLVAAALMTVPVFAQTDGTLPADLRAGVDRIAREVLEKASGVPFLEFLRARIFTPLGMTSVADIDRDRLGQTDPVGYLRYALGPPRPAPKEGKGWLFAAGELAMTAQDLARWNVALLEQ